MKKLLCVLVLVAMLFAAMSAVVYADQPPDKDPKPEGTQVPRGNSPDPCEGDDECGNGDHGKKDGKELDNPKAWQGEVDRPSTPEPPQEPTPPAQEPTEPAQEPTEPAQKPTEPAQAATPPAEDSVPGSAVQDEDCITSTIEAPAVVTTTETCDVCEELRAIRVQNEQILANQNIIITLLNKIYNVVVALIS